MAKDKTTAKSSKRTIELREVKLDTKELELQILHIDQNSAQTKAQSKNASNGSSTKQTDLARRDIAFFLSEMAAPVELPGEISESNDSDNDLDFPSTSAPVSNSSLTTE